MWIVRDKDLRESRKAFEIQLCKGSVKNQRKTRWMEFGTKNRKLKENCVESDKDL